MGFWWSKADWPATKREERRYPFFEDIRKLLTLIEQPRMGSIDIIRQYGKKVGDDYVPYDENIWLGSWDGYAAPDFAKPGEIKIVYKDHTGTEDIYVNWIEMSETNLNKYPPIKSDGKLDTRYWRLGVNPNYYCHYNQNAGKPEIGADGRYVVIYHLASETCGHLAYTTRLKAYEWLPRHTHPYRQVSPLKYKSGEVKQRRDPRLWGVEIKDEYITQNIGTEWARTTDTDEPCTKPRRLTEYVLEDGEPEDTDSDCKISGRCAHDKKMCSAYQDRVIRTAEHETQYLKKVDQTYIDAWSRRQGTIWNDYTTYSVSDIVHYNWDDGGFYCIQTNLNKPPPNAEYWAVPGYQPTLDGYHPVYAFITDSGQANSPGRFWCCNGSGYELLLKKIGHCDWWWDPAYPYIPKVLYDLHHDVDPDLWPLPVGCWRRTWKHSMGRVGTVMWPGEWGEPPEYFPDHWSITQEVYDAIPGGKTNYKVVNNPPDFTLTEEQEAALAKRHDPIAISRAKVGKATIIEPHYEIHHDLVNDMWNVLLKLNLIDWEVQRRYNSKLGENPLGSSAGPWDTSLEAYAGVRALALADEKWATGAGHPAWTAEFSKTLGYGACVYTPTGPDPFRSYFADVNRFFTVCLRVPHDDVLPGQMSGQLLLRIKYTEERNSPNTMDHYTECVFGFEDKIVTATPSDKTVWKWAYVKLEFCDLYKNYPDYYYFWYDGYILSPWPLTGKGGWMDFPDVEMTHRHAKSYIGLYIHGLIDEPEHQTVFNLDWDEVPEGVFEEDDSNVIKLKR